jgi:SAM-dependent methyltransferase
LEVAKRNLSKSSNVRFLEADLGALPILDSSLDFAYSLGVLHHVPSIEDALSEISRKIKPGGKLLLYLYYRFDQRPAWFQALWAVSDRMRRFISGMPFSVKRVFCDLVAAGVYWPFARLSRLVSLERFPNWPLAFYAHRSFYVMRTDALDRFGTQLEKRFTRREMEQLLLRSGFCEVSFSSSAPFWTAIAKRSQA